MKDTIYIVFDRRNVDRMTKREPQLARGEKMVQVTFEAPDSLWAPIPTMKAHLEVTHENAQGDAPIVLDPHDFGNGKGDTGQRSLNRIAAQLMERAINCNDEGLRKLALESLVMCRESGIEVRIDVPEADE